MDILLTHGYFLREDAVERRVMKPYPPLGILYLSAYLKNLGFDVSVYDTTFKSKTEFTSYVDVQRPPVIGFYVNLMTKLNVLSQIEYCKNAGCKIIVGGPDVPEYANEYLTAGADVVVIGEGEATTAELLPALLSGKPLENISGIAFHTPDGTYRTPPRTLIQDLDSLPLPDRAAIDLPAYVRTWKEHHGMGSVSLICARGCPFTCTWCSRSVFGETHRRRSPARVVDEIVYLLDEYKPDMLWFADDVFTINHKWFQQFYQEMTARKIRIPFECISRADRLNADILEKMAALGCRRIWYGSESGSQRILDAMQRKVTTEEIRDITAQARRFGIQSGLFVMLGYPGERIPDIEMTVELLKKAMPDVFLTTVAYPIKGTEVYKEYEHQLSFPPTWNASTDRNIRFNNRYSDAFYWFANRYVVNEVSYHKALKNHRKSSVRGITSFIKARISRLGMELTGER